jgi:O-methyltransferase
VRESATDGTAQGRLEAAEAELVRLRRQLRRTRKRLQAARAAITEAHHALPDRVEQVIRQVGEERLSYLGAGHLRNLATCIQDLEEAGVPGVVVEAGTARGGSAIVMAAAKSPERPMKVYDVFDMIPPPGTKDGDDVHERYAVIAEGGASGPGGDLYYGYHEDLYAEVGDSFARLGVALTDNHVELVKGLFEETIDLDGPVAFAHLDGDWYDSTMVCLTRIAPRLSSGGRLVVDDYYAWSGCHQAVDDYFRGRDEFRLLERAKLHVVRA